MKKRKLLDCTLRDGGYVNDWEFGHDQIIEIFERLVSSGVEYIEIGFLDERRSFDINRTIMPDTESANKIFAGADKGKSIVLAMIDYGTCSLNKLQQAKDTFIDGIRVIFKEHLMREALEFCAQIKAKGYMVFAQMVSVTTYSDAALKKYAALVNEVMPYATSMVDTYGLVDEIQLSHIFKILDKYVDKKICIGYHAHNNFQLGFANAKAFLSLKTKRRILADGTLYGMGKSAGNAPIELLMTFMNWNYKREYDIDQVMEAIDNVILAIYQKQYWGYNMLFYLAAAARCHPNYVSYLINKKTLSVRQINEILHGITEEKKLLYDAKYVENIYLTYQNINCDDKNTIKNLSKSFKNRKILLLGPGKSVIRQKKKIKDYIAEYSPVVIVVNYVPQGIPADYIFLTKTKRYTHVLNEMRNGLNEKTEIIATSNVTKTCGAFKYVLNYESLIDKNTEVIDNSLVMLLKAMLLLKIKDVSLAGFDGYSAKGDNYFNINREYSFAKAKARYFNEYVKAYIEQIKNKLGIKFITKSKYERKI